MNTSSNIIGFSYELQLISPPIKCDEKELNEAKTQNREINNFLIKSFFTNLQIINFIVVDFSHDPEDLPRLTI